GDERADVEVGDHVAVDDEEAFVDARLARREPHRPGGVERLVLDCVPQWHTCAGSVRVVREERVGAVAERQDDLVDAVRGEVQDRPFDHRPVDDRQHLLRRVVRERPQAGPQPSHQDDGLHGLLLAGTVVSGVEVAGADVAVVEAPGAEVSGVEVGAPPAGTALAPAAGTVVVEEGCRSLTFAMRVATSAFAGIVEPGGMNAIVNDSLAPRRMLRKPDVMISFGFFPCAASVTLFHFATCNSPSLPPWHLVVPSL